MEMEMEETAAFKELHTCTHAAVYGLISSPVVSQQRPPGTTGGSFTNPHMLCCIYPVDQHINNVCVFEHLSKTCTLGQHEFHGPGHETLEEMDFISDPK